MIKGATVTSINPKTPLSDFVNSRLSALGIESIHLVERMGFVNQAKGLRRLDQYLATGQETSHLLKNLPDVLGLDTVQVQAAAAATRKQIADKEEAAARERFHPHIEVLAKREDGVGMPFFIQAILWREKVLGLPDEFDGMTSALQVRQAARIVRRHFGENQGKLGTWGNISGYRLQRTFDHAVLLNTDGTVREGFNREPEPPAPVLRVGGKRVPVGMFLGG